MKELSLGSRITIYIIFLLVYSIVAGMLTDSLESMSNTNAFFF